MSRLPTIRQSPTAPIASTAPTAARAEMPIGPAQSAFRGLDDETIEEGNGARRPLESLRGFAEAGSSRWNHFADSSKTEIPSTRILPRAAAWPVLRAKIIGHDDAVGRIAAMLRVRPTDRPSLICLAGGGSTTTIANAVGKALDTTTEYVNHKVGPEFQHFFDNPDYFDAVRRRQPDCHTYSFLIDDLQNIAGPVRAQIAHGLKRFLRTGVWIAPSGARFDHRNTVVIVTASDGALVEPFRHLTNRPFLDIALNPLSTRELRAIAEGWLNDVAHQPGEPSVLVLGERTIEIDRNVFSLIAEAADDPGEVVHFLMQIQNQILTANRRELGCQAMFVELSDRANMLRSLLSTRLSIRSMLEQGREAIKISFRPAASDTAS